MAKGKHRNITNRNQVNMATSKPNSLTTASPGYSNTPENQYLDLKFTAHDADRELQEDHK